MSPRRRPAPRARPRARGRSRWRSRWRLIRGALGSALAVLLLAVFAFGGPALRRVLGLPNDELAAPRAGSVRVVTWNLRNYPADDHDHERLEAALRGLGASLLGLQEIADERALRQLVARALPGFELEVSARGGRGQQKLAIAFDPARIRLVDGPFEHDALALGGRVRPAYAALLELDGAEQVWFVVVHLKATPAGYDDRRTQAELLAAWIDELRRRDPDVILVGDFNATGTRDEGPAAELAAFDRELGRAALERLVVADGCTAYWDGPVRDRWKEPSLLDLVWIAGLEALAPPGLTAQAGAHCARHACAALSSTDAYPDPDYAGLSDHCPVYVDLGP